MAISRVIILIGLVIIIAIILGIILCVRILICKRKAKHKNDRKQEELLRMKIKDL